MSEALILQVLFWILTFEKIPSKNQALRSSNKPLWNVSIEIAVQTVNEFVQDIDILQLSINKTVNRQKKVAKVILNSWVCIFFKYRSI
jgi:hypothetical protein